MTHETAASRLPIAPLAYDKAFETIAENEERISQELVKTLAEIADTTFKDTGLALRSVHAKCHGILRGELRVFELPHPFAQGMFDKPRTLTAVARLSTSPGDLLDDKISTPRGFALKIIGVEGERLAGTAGAATQDFLMVDAPAFPAPDVGQFLGSLKLLAATTDRVPRLKRAFSAALQGAEKVIESVGGGSETLKALGGHRQTNILGETFYSQVPFLYGAHMAKWSIRPASQELMALKGATVNLHKKPDGLRAAVSDFFATSEAQWDLCVQLCTDIQRMPIEDSTVVWPESESPFVPVARLTVKPQDSWDAARMQLDEVLSFSPWHGLAAHRPLGSINRARESAYRASARARWSRGVGPAAQ